MCRQKLPSLPGYQVAQRSVPAAGSSGDYHQIIPLGRAVLAAAVADAKGKGFEAAVLVDGHCMPRFMCQRHTISKWCTSANDQPQPS